jgi:hypothetical protein
MQWNYRREQLRDIKVEQGFKSLNQHPNEENDGYSLTKENILNFENYLSEDMARMLQHAY